MVAHLRNELIERKRTLIPVDERLHLDFTARVERWPDEHDARRAGVSSCLELFRESLVT